MFKVFQTQQKYKTKKDWVTNIESVIKDLDLNVTFEKIEMMSKSTWRKITFNRKHSKFLRI